MMTQESFIYNICEGPVTIFLNFVMDGGWIVPIEGWIIEQLITIKADSKYEKDF